jgi:hypothetical protein
MSVMHLSAAKNWAEPRVSPTSWQQSREVGPPGRHSTTPATAIDHDVRLNSRLLHFKVQALAADAPHSPRPGHSGHHRGDTLTSAIAHRDAPPLGCRRPHRPQLVLLPLARPDHEWNPDITHRRATSNLRPQALNLRHLTTLAPLDRRRGTRSGLQRVRPAPGTR